MLRISEPLTPDRGSRDAFKDIASGGGRVLLKRRQPFARALKIVLLLLVAALAVECASAYFLYRFYALQAKEFEPKHSATGMLLERALERIRGVRRQVKVAVNPSPLFETSDVLGFTVAPGHHLVTEHFDDRVHLFDLTITPEGQRATAYFPIHKPRRLLITGDSAIFGWGVDDEETLPWLMQERVPDFQVENLSLNSYSTIHTLLQLRMLQPKVGADDVVVLVYHPVTNDFNVAAPGVLRQLSVGYEVQAGDTRKLLAMQVPFGTLDARNQLTIERVSLSCANKLGSPGCVHPEVSAAAAVAVTKRVFDEIIDLHAGRLVLAVLSGADDDPVIAYVRSRGLFIADLRAGKGELEDVDVIPTDLHAGPFWHHQRYVRLFNALKGAHIVE
jgi:hypothetical protein